MILSQITTWFSGLVLDRYSATWCEEREGGCQRCYKVINKNILDFIYHENEQLLDVPVEGR